MRLTPASLVAVALHLAAGALVYAALFLTLAIGAEQRRFYWMDEATTLVTRRRAAHV